MEKKITPQEARNLENFKEQVKHSMIKNYNYTEVEAKHLIKLYAPDFPQFFKEKWSIPLVITAIMHRY